MKTEIAEKIGLEALAFLAGNDDLLPVFQGSSGVSLQDMKASADDPEFLGSVLDFLLLDDAWVMQFCDAYGYEYSQPMTARAHLPGGQVVSWT